MLEIKMGSGKRLPSQHIPARLMESKCGRQEALGATLPSVPGKRKPQHLRQCQLNPRGTGCHA